MCYSSAMTSRRRLRSPQRRVSSPQRQVSSPQRRLSSPQRRLSLSKPPACPILTDLDVAVLARESAIVLDSWHLYDGTAVAMHRHRARFAENVAAVFGVSAEDAGTAYDHAVGHLPRSGSWFPAFVWTRDGLRLIVRAFPVERLQLSTTLDDTPLLDERKRPDIKGIDHLWQLERRGAAASRGYDDQLLVTADGVVSETIFGALAISDGTELIVPEAPRLPSVTLSVAQQHAGLTVRFRPVTVAEIAGAPIVLTFSALHGVRLVTRLGDRPYAGDARLRDALQQTLEGARRPLPEGGDGCEFC